MRVKRETYNFFKIIFCCSLLLLGFYTGFAITKSSGNSVAKEISKNLKEEIAKNNVKEEAAEEEIMANTKDVVTSSIDVYNEDEIKDLEIEYIDKYLLCGHDTSNTTNVYGISKKEFKKMLSEDAEKSKYVLELEEENKLTYVREHNEYCKDHYIVKIENGIVVIYNIVSEGICTKYKDTIIKEETIRNTLRKDLKNGIRADSQEELYSILEEIES